MLRSGRFRVFLAAAASCYVLVVLVAVVRAWRAGGVNSICSGQAWHDNLLAVIVPIYDGDENDAMTALSKWPATCDDTTLNGIDLVIYKAEDLADAGHLPQVPHHASKCFRRTKIIEARLLPEENVYPTGASIMFYKIFLDPDVAESLAEYDAFAIIEWDVLVAHPTSFSRLYDAAFSSEPFWMKGSTLAGTEFHQTARVRDEWHVLGHLNGNALYNNTDQAFTQFVNFTLAKWELSYSYDVALWATLSDLPYSWMIWQRYSSLFVATKLITNVGHFDVNDQDVAQAIAHETLFIHGSSKSEGSFAQSANHIGARPIGALPIDVNSFDCTSACGSARLGKIDAGVSTFCDESCATGWWPGGPRFGGHDCGAGDPSQFGGTCRLCYMDEKLALIADRSLASSSTNPSTPDAHVVMCNTTRPPPASSCTTACQDSTDTVCDYRCGSGRYGDFNCDWRGLGSTCRLCFHEFPVAHLADEFARVHGGRVIMCNTHEPPPEIGSYTNDKEEENPHGHADAGNGPTLVIPSPQESNTEIVSVDEEGDGPAATEYIGTTTRGHMCAFMHGHSRLLSIMKVSVSSVLEFMTGMRIGIATHPRELKEFNRAFGHLPGVTIGTSTNVEYAPLIADYICGEGTRLIYYMDVGQVVSRTFTKKDTHTVLGDLIVSLVSTDKVPPASAARGMGSSVLLGVTTRTFTHESDVILPAETNAQLRAVLNGNQKLGRTDAQIGHSDRMESTYEYLAGVASTHQGSVAIHIPEVLAALAYSRSPPGVTFVNTHEWSHQHLFSDVSIWDVPMVKPRFGCSIDRSLGRQGYDMGEIFAKELEALKLGASCERGFKSVDVMNLGVKTDRQLTVQGAEQRMPNLLDYDVTIVYRSFVGDAKLFNSSIATVIEHVSSAFEVVVVVVEADVALFESIVQPFRIAAPFPIRVIGEPQLMDGKLQQKYSKLRADLYTEGDYILHLDSDAIVFQDVSFEHMFHLGKPVLPFRRYEKNRQFEEWTETVCWQRGTSSAIGKDVIHEFGILNTQLYARSMYPAAREFIEHHHGMPFVDFMASRRGSCPNTTAEWTQDQRALMFSHSNFVGAYLWYHMHDAVHWLAVDLLDARLNGWGPDLRKLERVCQVNRRYAPEDPALLEPYLADYKTIKNFDQCVAITTPSQQSQFK